MNINRIRIVSEAKYEKGSVLCALGRDIRAEDNDALLYASSLAHKHGCPLLVTVTIWPKFLGATSRYYDFFYEGLKETEKKLRALGIPVILLFGKEDTELENFIMRHAVGFLVTDFLPLSFSKRWKEKLSKKIAIPWYEVDAHNIVPAWITSPKQEFAARTIRPKLYNLLPDYIDEYEDILPFTDKNTLTNFPAIDFVYAYKKTEMRTINGSQFIGGESCAKKVLSTFLLDKLNNYDESRNDFGTQGQSDLSPYISKGMISRRRIALTVLENEKKKIQEILKKNKNGANEKEGSVSAFLEELIVRAELAENYCFYNENYARVEGAASWAQATLAKASTDKRDYLYTRDDFELALTHDDLWNACQMQMVKTGKMHGYLRMYWAKKILEWTASPQEALDIAIYLNDTYELDGLDPNGYAGSMWSIAGLHDRTWFPRPIFGNIRYMAESGAKKRGNVVDYIQVWSAKK